MNFFNCSIDEVKEMSWVEFVALFQRIEVVEAIEKRNRMDITRYGLSFKSKNKDDHKRFEKLVTQVTNKGIYTRQHGIGAIKKLFGGR